MRSFEAVHLNNVSNMVKKAIAVKAKQKGKYFTYEQCDDMVAFSWEEKGLDISLQLCPAYNGHGCKRDDRCELEVTVECSDEDVGVTVHRFVPILWSYNQLSGLIDKLVKEKTSEAKKEIAALRKML